MASESPKQRPDRWPLLVGVLLGLGVSTVVALGQFDWAAAKGGNASVVAEAVGRAVGGIMLGLIGGAIYRETVGRKKPTTPD